MVINALWHGDHIFGNQAFRRAFPSARFVAHAATRAGIITGEAAFAFVSSPRAWIQTLNRLAALDAATLVPRHGPVQREKRFVAGLQAMLRAVVEQVDAGLKEGLDLEALKARVKVVPPAGSLYENVSAASLDRNFRLPAIESAVKEKG